MEILTPRPEDSGHTEILRVTFLNWSIIKQNDFPMKEAWQILYCWASTWLRVPASLPEWKIPWGKTTVLPGVIHLSRRNYKTIGEHSHRQQWCVHERSNSHWVDGSYKACSYNIPHLIITLKQVGWGYTESYQSQSRCRTVSMETDIRKSILGNIYITW